MAKTVFVIGEYPIDIEGIFSSRKKAEKWLERNRQYVCSTAEIFEYDLGKFDYFGYYTIGLTPESHSEPARKYGVAFDICLGTYTKPFNKQMFFKLVNCKQHCSLFIDRSLVDSLCGPKIPPKEICIDFAALICDTKQWGKEDRLIDLWEKYKRSRSGSGSWSRSGSSKQ